MSQIRDILHVTAFISALNSSVASSPGSGGLKFCESEPLLRYPVHYFGDLVGENDCLDVMITAKAPRSPARAIIERESQKPSPSSVCFPRPVDAF